MFDLFINGCIIAFSLENILFILLGTFIGIVFGAIPGLSTDLGVILFLPLTFSLNPVSGILLLLSIYCGGMYGGSISSILIGTPGTNVAVVTTFDGYPLTLKGKARKALSMALLASTIGGLISAILLLFTAPFISRFVMQFGPPEYFTLAILGLSIIAGVSGDSLLRGVALGCFGFFISMIGVDAASGATRFTFNSMFLMKGLGLLPVLLGVFALPNIYNKICSNTYNELNKMKTDLRNEDKLTIAELKECLPAIFRGTIIGSIVGAIPGAGGSIAAFIAYNESKRTSINGHKFGTGELEGIAAPESANNAVTGCSLIPLFTLGIPGSVVAALLIGSFTMHGLIPGPMLFRTQAPLMYAIMAGLILCNIAMYFEGKYLLKLFANITRVPQRMLFTGLILFCVAGSFSFSNELNNVYVLLVFGAIMYILGKFGFHGAPFVLGIILGPMAEVNLRNSLVMSNGLWLIFFTRPISIIILILTILITAYSMKKTKNIKKNGAQQVGQKEKESLDD